MVLPALVGLPWPGPATASEGFALFAGGAVLVATLTFAAARLAGRRRG
jgi:hypothetical protein